MFDIETAIADWRRQMLAAGVKNPNVLEELESHLREDMELQMRTGLSAEQAFGIAVQRIGQPAALRDEFAKSSAAKGTRLQRWRYVLWRFIGLPLPSPNVFAFDVRETLELGRQEALAFHHDFIGTEHVLLGLLESKTGVVRNVLRKMGVDHKIIRGEIEKVVGLGSAQQVPHALPYTPRVKKALKIAGSEARSLNRKHIRAEHIFLGLLREGGGVAALVLKNLGVDIRAARAAVVDELGRNQSEV
jgi:hypothetical protein